MIKFDSAMYDRIYTQIVLQRDPSKSPWIIKGSELSRSRTKNYQMMKSSISVVNFNHKLTYSRYLVSNFIKIRLGNKGLSAFKISCQKLLKSWRHQWVKSVLIRSYGIVVINMRHLLQNTSVFITKCGSLLLQIAAKL